MTLIAERMKKVEEVVLESVVVVVIIGIVVVTSVVRPKLRQIVKPRSTRMATTIRMYFLRLPKLALIKFKFSAVMIRPSFSLCSSEPASTQW